METPDDCSSPTLPLEGGFTRRRYDGPLCLHELIEEQAERAPERVAVRFEDASLTYRELLDRAGHLARHLAGMGVGPDVRVGVCAERSLEMVVGLLGVLRAGGAYVPLDPSYPAERLAYMVGDAAAPVVLTQRRLASLLPPHGARTVLLDDPETWGTSAAPLPQVPPDALAYVIYTSGSTGRPKGAMNAHRGVRNRLLWMRDDFGLGPDEVVLQKTPFSFDLSVWEIFATLMTGARLVMARPGGHQDSAYLVEVMEREGITIAHFVPSMLRAFLSAPGLERCTALRRVLCTGEAVSEDLERRFFERFGTHGPELYNLYGPTEAAVEVTWWQCGPGRSGPVPIGRPLPNTSIHLVDPDLEPVSEGELLIGGIQVARGYHGRPDLTAERFIPDPFGEPGSRLYRTGDLARFRPDGVLDFLGRIDFQVKVRGHRIELGEIETRLASHPSVHEAVVVARERNDEMRLVAYLVRKAAVEKEALRAHLAASLPDYMVPADWVFLEAFPLTPSGKIDRRALPEPERVRVEHVPPRTPLERFLAALWEETLGVERVGLRDSFFDLGGTSITGAVVINRLQAVMGEILHVVALFDAPTLAELAAHLGREHRTAVARVWGEESLPADLAEEAGATRVDEARLAELRALVQPLAPLPSDEPKNPPVLFVLAPPRSGTTLLRVMLGGHSDLFSPPELELLTFNTLAERRAAFPGRDSFWLEGVLRAVMEARGCALDEARELVEACEREGWTIRRFYRRLQEWVGGRTLVDKSTNYPLDPAVLRRAEETFESPFYLHLVRHPYGMIHSFEEAKIDQVFFRRPHPFARRELAELIWTVSQRNILAFLETVPPERRHRLLFEDLVRDPERELRRLCAALGIEYHPGMADPYKEKRSRMTDGLHAEGRMLGDMKFHEHRGVDAGTAERWREVYAEDFLGEPTWETALALGYPRTAPDAIVPIPRSRPLPLSPAQERLWFLDRLAPGSPVYNSCREVRLHGPLDTPAITALAGALGAIVERHEALRTVFGEAGEGPVQVILPAAPVRMAVVDLSGLPHPPRRAEARRIALETARLPFDLRRDPMLRALLVRLEPEEHALRLDVHHSATDGWSMGVLLRELEALYRGETPAALPVQYADYAVWQRRWLEREGPAQLEAWRLRLQGLPPALELPADRPRPAVQALDGALERMALPAELARGLEEVGRQAGATLFMVLLAGFQGWLHRITGREDLAVGVPSANRGRPEIERLIGFFVNNLVIRADLSGDPPFAEALGRVREAALFAYAHPDLPFERLVAELAPERDLSRPPIYQAAFSLQDPLPALDFGSGLRGEMSDVHTGTAKLDLWLQVDREDAGWSLRAEYPTALFDAATVRRWLGHLRVLFEGIAANPETRLSDLPLLTPEECEQLVVWNRTAAEIPAEPVHRLFRRWAERAPGALAISWEGGSLSYGEVAERVDRMAEELREQGVGPETVVALCLQRSPELVISALAVLEAGGAYLPIDPAQPAERREWILRDSGALTPLPLSQPHTWTPGRGEGGSGTGISTRGSASGNEAEADGSKAGRHTPPSPGGPGVRLGEGMGVRVAYVIYTSGSTGTPKGTELRHRGLSSLIAWHRRTYGLGPADRTTLLAGPGFDASVWETWAPLTAGASLHIPPADTILSPPALLAWMAEQGITVSFLPTPLAEAVLAEPLPEGLALRALLTGGDRLRRRPAPGLPFEVVNHYGPTEATVVATAGRVSAEGDKLPDIGTPIANTRVYLLDRGLRPVPVGVAGEICLAGEGLARGYRGRPELTAERFVPDPFGEGRRLYRTGDLARWTASGAIEFVGRADDQVKIRGHRIELGEIEAALGRHPAVREAVVLALDGRLVAYVVGDSADLQSFLSGLLPEPMVPSAWVSLDRLPLTPNGKVDRRALAGIAPRRNEETAEPPRAGLETELAEVWAELLGVSAGRRDDFFALGGHSLLAARLAFRVRERLGVELPLRAVFEAPTLAALAARIRELGAAEDLPLAAGAPRPAPASFAQQRLWFLDRLQPGSPAFNMPFVLRFSGPLRPDALRAALETVVRRHEALRTTLALPEGEMEPVQIVAEPSVSMPVVEPAGMRETEAEAGRLIADEARRPFDLEAGPLLRTTLLRLSDEDHRLLLTMHHAVSDGWSMGVLLRELREALRGEPLPPLPVQYSDFAVWQRQWLSGERLEAQLAFWKERLAGREGAVELPSDRPRPAVASLRGARESLRLPDGLLGEVERTGRRHGATPFATLLAAFCALVHRVTGQEDLVIGSPVAGRPRREVEGLIGLFVNLLPLRVRLDGELSLATLLERAREAVVTGLEHHEVPFERLVAELEPERDLSRHPVFQLVLLVEEELEIEEIPTGTAKMDLTLALTGSILEARYATDLFDAATMRRLLGHYRNLLQGIAEAGGEAKVSDLPLLDAAEREQVLRAWNRTEEEIPEEPVHRLFFRWAERTPDAPAVVWEGGSLTYGELAGRAQELAGRLREQGVGPETLVAICLERSPELLTAALAVLEAGGAYLPIDPAYPEERRAWIVRDSGALTPWPLSQPHARTPGRGEGGSGTDLSTRGSASGNEAEMDGSKAGRHTPPSPGGPGVRLGEGSGVRVAYVIYTSGSTGTPKGTELCHRGLSSLIAWHRRAYGLGPGDRSALLAGPGFDASVWETWAALASGAALHIPPRDVVLSPAALLAWMAEHGITVSFLPTPLAEAVLAEPLPEGLALRALLTGGDRLLRRPALDLPFALFNHYGPTESTVVATAGRVSSEGERPPEIGVPIDNVRAYVLDRGLQPVPVGAPGELCLAGEGLARGYRGRPELTAERFVPDPFAEGNRLYRTGDLVRWLPSGELEFLGRLDHQVKIRGFRIELGEIEAVLSRHPAVREAAVLARDGRLVAFVAAPPETDLRGFLAASLPDAMVPAGWVFLERLPLTPNGKVDRRALSAFEVEAEVSEEVRTPLEELVAGVFSQVLGLDRAVGRNEDFFHLGGHSLLAARLAARAGIGVRDVFERSTVAGLAEAMEGRDRVDGPPLVPVPREGALPLSFAQQRLWFLESLQPGTPLYNLPQVWHLKGSLSVPRLEEALGELVRRHESLRTVFTEEGQVVLPAAPCPLPLIEDLDEEIRRPFDLEKGPLFRAALVRLGEEEHRLVLAMHHIVSDGASMDVLARELSSLYRGETLPPLPIQYPDFAVWQRSRGVLESHLAWWRERLAGAPVVLELPTDRPRTAVAGLAGATERIDLGEELDAALARIARHAGATFFMTVLAAFQALLRRWTAQDDLLVGSAVEGRDRRELEGLVGFFVNLVPLRAVFAGDPTFDHVLGAAREMALGAFAHQEVPFERLVDELAPERDLSRAPLVQTLLLVRGEAAVPDLPGVEAAPVRAHPGTAKFDLTLTLGRGHAQVEYASGLFDAATARRLLGHFRTLLRGIAADPGARLSDLPLLDEAERAQLAAWNREMRRDHPEGLIHELFEERARRTPEALAIVAAGERLTYAELERRSADLAGHLRTLGAGPEVPVGVFLKRSADLVTALLGVLRSGGFYVPIDPAYPAERIAFLLEDSGCSMLLSHGNLLDKLPPTEAKTVLLDGEWTGNAPPFPPLPGNLAYLIYTSGSTGRPKGVAIEHRSAAVLARWAREAFAPEELSGVIASTSVTFDLSVFEIFVTLAWGGTVFLVENALAVPDFFAAEELAPTLINTVPSAMAELLRIDGLPASVRTVNLAGEALARALSDRVYERPATERLYNLYGPSEDTTYSTWALVERSGERTPAIGRPVHDTGAWVLDPDLRPLPVGVPGELHLSGRGLARGYRGRPELTADRFVPDPFGEPGGRMYRTGDRVRLLPDGDLEYLGRLDHQVKIRGFRIELGEVEAALARHPAVRQAAVLARAGRLVACVAGPSTDLRSFLAERLPEPMVPGQWLFLDELPLTPNGKVDRKALAQMELPEAAATSGAPRNPVEELLAALFAEVLELSQPPGVRDDFFRLGGHSLLAVRLASRVREAFRSELPVRAVFEHPTVAGLAEALAGPSPAPPLVPVERNGAIPLSFAQERLWFLDRFEGGTSAYNLPLVFHIRGEGLRVDALAEAIAGVVRRHEALRTVFRDGPEQVVLPLEATLDVVEVDHLLELAELPFDLTRGPLLRAVLLRVSDDDHRLLLSMHHVASDGWSVGVLARELSALYLGEPLPELPVQYADYAVWQRGWLAGETLEAELAWWRERLSGIPAGLELPTDRPRPAVQSYRGGVQGLAVDSATLAALGRRCGATFFMAALAAFDALLHRVTHAEDLVVGTPVANRDRAEVEGLVGFFVNTLALRTSLAGDPAFEELLARVRASSLEAYAHQDLPFEKLVAELSPERDLSRHPLFQVSLSVQEGQQPRLDLGPGLETALSEVRIPTSKFDLSLHLGRGLAQVEYASDLFDEATIDRLLGCFRTLLAGIAETPAARISELPLLSREERDQLRLLGGEAAPGRTLHGLVAEQARRAPGAVALVADDGRITTYGEMMERASSLARRLHGLGVRAETRVALCAERSPELVIGLLGILEAGGACVPLDPGHLSERLSFVLEDSGALVLATTSELSPRLPAGVPRVLLDHHEDVDGSLDPVLPEQIAYVIYTSGSTGRPKGVAVSHGEAAAHCETVIRLYGVHPGDRVLQLASPAFDVSLEEILSTLGAGAALVLRDGMWDAESTASLGITILNLPSAVWHHWAHDALAKPPALRLIVVGGEEVLAEPARQWLRSPLAEIPVLNGYGPTEAVITATLHTVAADTLGTTASVPIGRPLPGRSAIVLDPRGNPVPPGVSGELHLGGCLARGYLGRPGLTAERFVPDPFGEPGARLYRTGDLVRYREDALEFLGRIDQQIKIRGFRVEPAEIEAALAACPGVAASAVVVRESGREKQLVAFIEPDGTPPSVDDLRSFLEARLPAWMVPAGFAVIGALPLNASGKVDRAALARLPVEVRRAETEAPRTEAERELAEIWEELLGVEGVGRGDDFFHLGGHSLLAMRLVSRMRGRFGAGLELRDVFEAPTLAGQAARLAPETREEQPGEPRLVRAERGSEAPLSFAQERIWFLDRLEPGSIAYNLPVSFLLRGPLRIEALAAALSEVVRRHEALRTVFREGADGVPVQVVQDAAPVPLPVVDLSGLPDEADRLEVELARRPFDLARGPLLRAVLLRTGDAEHRLFLGLHHIVFDGWSAGVLERELAAVYRHGLTRTNTDLHGPESSSVKVRVSPCSSVQYADYSIWQRRWLTGEVLASELGWWRERLAGVPAVLTLPSDRPRPARRSFRGVVHRDALPAELASELAALGRAHDASPFMVLLAGYQALLARLSGADRLLVGTPIASRRHAEVEGLIGLFVNTLALPADLSDAPSFVVHLERTRDLLMGAFGHQDLPFERLVEELAPERDLSRTPLVQTMIVHGIGDGAGAPVELAPGLTLEPHAIGSGVGTSKMDLSLHLGEAGDGSLAVAWAADADLFDPATVTRISGWLRNLLERLAATPERAVREVSLLSEAERRQLQVWSGDVPGEAQPTILERMAFWMETTPDAPAVFGTGEPITWRELDLRSARLARRLRGLGAGPEARVAVCLERSPDLVVTLLGVLRSGAAYVVFEPDQPPGRRRKILEGSGSLALVTRQRLVPDLDSVPRVRIEEARIEDGQEGVPVDRPQPSSLAYVLYTSGSTGEPKGVAVEHRQLASYVAAVLERLDLPQGSSFATVTTFAADLGHTSLFGALASGGTLHVVPRELSADPARLALRFAAWPVDALKIVPSHLAALLAAAPSPERVLPRRRLVVGGEAATWELIGRVRELAPDCRILNHYGPTETTVGVLTSILEERVGERPPLGRPLRGNVVRLLDPAMGPVPVGVPGEVWIGGVQVARGYLGQPDRTAERFLPDPYGEPGARLYRTGDLARWLPSGDLEFLGRADDQLKVRGHRVEPGEVAAALARHPAVGEAAVLPVERAGETRLAACVVPAPGADVPGRGELRAWLAERLPEPMVPSEIVLLDALPLTPNGKLDRWALRAITTHAEVDEEPMSKTAPASPAEELMATLFAELLGRERVALADDFFELGGHSLLAVRLLARAREVFGTELDVRSVFERRTVAGLAARVEELLRGEGDAMIPPPLRRLDHTAAPLSFAQERLWFLDRLEPGTATYNVVRELRLRGPLDAAALAAALGEVARRHEPLRTRFEAVDGEPVQIVLPFSVVPLPLADLSALPEPALRAEASRLAAEEGRRPFDLRRGPLLRAALLRLAAEEHVLLLGVHHIAFDGWSLDVLRRELGALYAAFAAGKPSPLPELPVRYADYAVWQRQWLRGEVLEAQLGWWRERLAGSPPALELPFDRPRPEAQSLRGRFGGMERAALPSGLFRGRGGATPFMTLLAGVQAFLHRITGQDGFLVGTPVANRDRAEVQGLVGFFVNTLVLRADLSGDPAFPELLARVRETALAAWAHQDLPFERLVQDLAPGRDLARTPLFQVLFSWQPPRAGSAELAPGLGMEIADVDSGTSKFDLSLFLGESREGPGVAVEYAADLFDRATIRRLVRGLGHLLEGIAADDRAPVSALPLLGAEERAQLVREWNDTATDYPRQATIHGLFEEQARLRPDAVAVVCGDEELTYEELDRQAERIALRLLALGVRPDDAVGLCAERSTGLIAALLGILKASGAYLPLDPQYPVERLAGMLEDAGARVLVVEEGLEDRLPAGTVRLPLREALASEGRGPLSREAGEGRGGGPDNLAYVLFTSGSTGRPKGVAVTHRNVVRLVRDTGFFRFGPEEVFLQFAPVSFDASTLEIWGPLLNGGRLAVFPPGPPDLRLHGDVLESHGVTALWLTAGLFHQMVESHLPRLRNVRQLMAGGDVLSPDHVRRALAGLPRTTLINGYGPTEGTTFTNCHRMEGAEAAPGVRVPIGRPISNSRAYLLDAALRPVPIGVVGQLYAAGDGLARGYAGRPDLTAERFVPDPVTGEPGARLYATGDLARWLPGGDVDFLGRADHQVKLRGFRIELGEIEAAFADHPDVETAVVVAREDRPGDRRLVAYVVPAPGEAPDVAELRGFLSLRLPAWMVPAAFVLLPVLPLTANGKVDRRALPAPELAQGAAEATPPRTPLEREVAQVWSEVLGVERVGVEDSFWDLGGHSLLATKVLARLGDSLGVDLPLQALFEAPTLAGFAEKIGRHLLASSGTDPELGDLLDELEGLSEVELQALIEEESNL